MKKGMCIAYEVGSGLYINITNRCSNRCSFCIRNNGDGAYGSDSLWLIREPSREEIFAAVFERELSKYEEIVFCGYGEPSYRLGECVALAREIKSRYPGMKTRINTNGQSDLILECDSAPLYKDAFDTVSISLNTCDAEKYDAMCHPVYKLDAFEAIRFIHSIGAVSVLAHPFLNLSQEELPVFLQQAKRCGLDAMETYYPKFTTEQMQVLCRMAEEYGLLRSGGSDFHGDNKPDIRLGTGRDNLQVPADLLEAMKERLARRKNI